ncbi:glycosyltransferase [Eggerthellaceae bacterium zg-887]|uniref:glycosyltransferase family 2 protein n=1 Tax=Xiamenia xianingshaonis TaxID=2682776 RepID=UPI001407841C|nr:glycosyltransferase family 2 protein [Xiamenia xianingshaonis]NHM16162.1 glycosyltransferase [Xiamenia xianingshaonis]
MGQISAPKVSVLMPSLNVARFIRESIQSVVSQTLDGLEVICIDSGSTDGTLEIIEEFADRYENVSLVRSPVKSYGAQMNLGLKRAQGEYIGIVETDDYVDADAFEKLYAIGVSNSCDIVKSNRYSKSETSDERIEILRGLPYDKVFQPVPDLLNIFNPAPSIWTSIYRRDFLVDHGIDFLETPGASFQDTGFVYKSYIAANSMMLTQEAFLHYRVDNEASSVKSKQKVFCVMDEFSSIESFMSRYPEKKKLFWDKYCELKFRTYEWNTTRLESPELDEFMSAFASEFRNMMESDPFSLRYFSTKQRESLETLIGGGIKPREKEAGGFKGLMETIAQSLRLKK